MKIEKNELEDRQVELTVEVPQEMVSTAMRKSARQLSKQVKIPGFRPGKAPYDVIIRRFGEDAVFEEALETLGQEVYSKALDEAEVSPAAVGSFNDIVSRDPLVLKYTVPLPPEVELGSYEDLRVDFDEPEISEEAEEEVLAMLKQSRAVIEPVERPAELSDLVVADIHGALVSEDDTEEEDEDIQLAHDHSVTLLVSEEGDYPFPGIHEHLIGLEAGQEKEIQHTFPDDYESEDLRGRTATFTIKCLDVKSRDLPELTDELASEIGEFESIEDMRQKVRDDMLNRARTQALESYNQEVIQQVVDGSSISYPPALLEQEVDDMIQEVNQNLQQRSFNLEDQLKLENKTMEEFRKEIEPDAEARLKRSLVLGKIVEDQELTVAAPEIDAELSMIRARFPQADEELDQLLNHPIQRHRIQMDLLTRKAVERISLIARGEYNPDEEPAGEAEAAEDEADIEQAETEEARDAEQEPAADTAAVESEEQTESVDEAEPGTEE